MVCAGVTLEIFIDPKHPERVTDPEAKGLRHIAFVVESLEDIMKVVECEEIRTDWFGRRFTFCKDPDGQPIELKEKAAAKPANSNDPFAEEYMKQTGKEVSFF